LELTSRDALWLSRGGRHIWPTALPDMA